MEHGGNIRYYPQSHPYASHLTCTQAHHTATSHLDHHRNNPLALRHTSPLTHLHQSSITTATSNLMHGGLIGDFVVVGNQSQGCPFTSILVRKLLISRKKLELRKGYKPTQAVVVEPEDIIKYERVCTSPCLCPTLPTTTTTPSPCISHLLTLKLRPHCHTPPQGAVRGVRLQ